MKTIQCPRCRSQHETGEYETAQANGTLEELCYSGLMQRTNEAITGMKELASESFKAGDMITFNEMKGLITRLEITKATMRKPYQQPI
jgi:hypothetical protein